MTPQKIIASFSAALLAGGALLLAPCQAQDAKPAASPAAAPKPSAPAVLPGNGLAQHDFFYAGEAKTWDMFIVRKGQIAWEYHHPFSRGEISDAVLLSNGNILFAHQYGVTLMTPERQVLWHLTAPSKTEIHTAQPIGLERVLYVQNGDSAEAGGGALSSILGSTALYVQNGNPAKAVVVNIVTGQIEKEFTLPVKNPQSTHGHFRHARLTDAGTLLVAHMDMGKVCEYDAEGKEVWSVDVGASPWSAARLKNGHTLICSSRFVREVNPQKETVWEFASADVPEYQFASMQLATRLPNGNTLINNWVNQWSGKIDPAAAPVQALEVTPEKKIVWALRAWTPPVDLGPSTTIQLLDEPGAPEAVHFGGIK